MDRSDIDTALHAVGALLATEVAIVVVGGASMTALAIVTRATRDVDVIARAESPQNLIPPDPLPDDLVAAITRVARDFQLEPDWMNTTVGRQFAHGLPPGITDDIEWRAYGRLAVGFAGRHALIPLKLFATVDQDRRSVHYQDLLALSPNDEELDRAAAWVITQDAADSFPQLVADGVQHVRADLGRV
jgi:hypothetical protein